MCVNRLFNFFSTSFHVCRFLYVILFTGFVGGLTEKLCVCAPMNTLCERRESGRAKKIIILKRVENNSNKIRKMSPNPFSDHKCNVTFERVAYVLVYRCVVVVVLFLRFFLSFDLFFSLCIPFLCINRCGDVSILLLSIRISQSFVLPRQIIERCLGHSFWLILIFHLNQFCVNISAFFFQTDSFVETEAELEIERQTNVQFLSIHSK